MIADTYPDFHPRLVRFLTIFNRGESINGYGMEDLVSHAYERVCKSPPRLVYTAGSLFRYMQMVCKRLLLDERRKVVRSGGVTSFDLLGPTITEEIIDPDELAESRVLYKETFAKVTNTILNFSPLERETLEYHLQGIKPIDMGRNTHLTYMQAKGALQRVRQKIAKGLEEHNVHA